MLERTGERRTKEGGRKERERKRETEALLSHHISRVYGVRGKEGQQTCRARRVTVGTGERGGLAEEEDEARRELRGEERERDSWFTCRHGNAASPLTCYSIGIARPSAAVLSQPPQEYERESRSIAWDRERADASFPMGERSLACFGGAISLPRRRSPRRGSSLFFFSRRRRRATRRAEKEKEYPRARYRDTRSPSHNTHYIGIITEETLHRGIFIYIYIVHVCTCTLAVLSPCCFLSFTHGET